MQKYKRVYEKQKVQKYVQFVKNLYRKHLKSLTFSMQKTMACITSSINLLYLIKSSWYRWIIDARNIGAIK